MGKNVWKKNRRRGFFTPYAVKSTDKSKPFYFIYIFFFILIEHQLSIQTTGINNVCLYIKIDIHRRSFYDYLMAVMTVRVLFVQNKYQSENQR